jgi:hypothetical protein
LAPHGQNRLCCGNRVRGMRRSPAGNGNALLGCGAGAKEGLYPIIGLIGSDLELVLRRCA